MRNLMYANIPARFSGVELSNFKQDYPEAYKQASEWLSMTIDHPFRNLGIIGPIGTGKTTLGVSILKQFCEIGFAKYATLAELTEMQYRSYDDYQAYKTVSLLMIDELGRGSGTEKEANRIFELIDYRYREMLPIIFACNARLDKIPEVIGKPAFDRLKENLDVIKLVGESKR